MKKKLLLLLLLCIMFSMHAQIRFIEVNTSTNIIKIKNFGDSTVNISSYQLCDFPTYPSLNTLNVTNGSLNLAAGAEVTIDISGSITMNTNEGELGLYINGPFGTASNMRDYIQWGSSMHTREGVANTAGIWVAGTFISSSAPSPYTYTGDGTSFEGVNDWDPTLSTEVFSLNNFRIISNLKNETIQVKLPKNFSDVEVNIYNMLGKLVHKISNHSNQKIDITEWNSGIYLVKVRSDNQVSNKLFAKK